MNWDDPAARAALIDRVGPDEYERQFHAHVAESTVATVNGHGIRPIGTRWGTLFAVAGSDKAFRTVDDAKAFAETLPVTP